jgi:hypothetical protein
MVLSATERLLPLARLFHASGHRLWIFLANAEFYMADQLGVGRGPEDQASALC